MRSNRYLQGLINSILLALCLLLVATQIAFGQDGTPDGNSVDLLSDYRMRAQALLLVKDYQGAKTLLEEKLTSNPQDTESNFLLAQAYIGLQQMDEAIRVLSGILDREPQLSRIRLELARAYALNRQKELAKKEFERVLSTNPPRTVGDNIRQFQDAMAAQKDWNLRLAIGVLHDTNVNSGPLSSTVNMFGAPFTLDSDAKSLEDNAITTSITADFTHPFSMLSAWQTSLAFNHTGYFHYSNYDSQVFSVSTGPTWKNGSTTYSIPLVMDITQMSYELYSNTIGLTPQVQHDFSKNHALIISSVLQGKFFQRAWMKNGTTWNVTGGYRYTFGAGYIQPSIKYGEDDARENIYSYTTNAASIGIYINPYGDYSLFIQPATAVNKYRGQENAYDAIRLDHQNSLNLNLSKPLGDSGYSLVAGYTYTDNQSNIDMYKYKREQFTLQLSKQF